MNGRAGHGEHLLWRRATSLGCKSSATGEPVSGSALQTGGCSASRGLLREERRERTGRAPSSEVPWMAVLTGADVGRSRDRRSGDSRASDGIEANGCRLAEQEERCAVRKNSLPDWDCVPLLI